MLVTGTGSAETKCDIESHERPGLANHEPQPNRRNALRLAVSAQPLTRFDGAAAKPNGENA